MIMSSANLRWLRYSPSIKIPLLLQFKLDIYNSNILGNAKRLTITLQVEKRPSNMNAPLRCTWSSNLPAQRHFILLRLRPAGINRGNIVVERRNLSHVKPLEVKRQANFYAISTYWLTVYVIDSTTRRSSIHFCSKNLHDYLRLK